MRVAMVINLLLISLTAALDLHRAADNYLAFMRTRGDISGAEVVYHWTGEIYSFVPEKQSVLLFDVEGYNIARLEEYEDGYRMLSREVLLYLDPDTGEILLDWFNPFTGRTEQVVHVWNDPVNSEMPRSDGSWEFRMPYSDLGNGMISWDLRIFVTYPSPLPASQFPEFSGSDLYQGCELFGFITSLDDLENAEMTSVPASLTWTRIGQWLPWMRMADSPGYLVYHCSGSKLEGGYPALPAYLREFVELLHPEFVTAPEEYSRPNETSWTFFRKVLQNN
jgi:hypothetical protein